MYKSLLAGAVLTALIGIPLQAINLRIAHHFRLLDIPTARRRHPFPTPITGGTGVILNWLLGVMIFSLLEPNWIQEHLQSLTVIGVCAIVLMLLGLADDLRGLSSKWKLAIETLVSIGAITLVPELRQVCQTWTPQLGLLVWPFAVIWLVGITNAFNLIDGLDGLAGGISVLAFLSIGALCILQQDQSPLSLGLVSTLLPATLVFLKNNWPPAKMFLGDNGSLPLGFLIAASSAMSQKPSPSWTIAVSMILMLGYPILDMGLASLRRYISNQPIFKADRYHLHYRIQRLGLLPQQTLILLLSISLYLQFSGVALNILPPIPALVSGAIGIYSIVILLHLIYSIEQERAIHIFNKLKDGTKNNVTQLTRALPPIAAETPRSIVHLDLTSLLESALREENSRYVEIISALELLVRSLIRKEDSIVLLDQKMTVYLRGDLTTLGTEATFTQRLKDKVEKFLSLYEIQGSLSGIPIRIEHPRSSQKADNETAKAA